MRELIFLGSLAAMVALAAGFLAEPPIDTLDTHPVVIERCAP